MIEGLQFDIEFEEMGDHLREKARHHDERRVFYERQAKTLEEGKAEGMDYTGGDPIKALRDKGRVHQNRSELFQFMADHLIEGETYRLSESDLMTLEFISRSY
jgi:hypothetical protein